MKRIVVASLISMLPISAMGSDHSYYRMIETKNSDSSHTCDLRAETRIHRNNDSIVFALSIQDDGPYLMRIVFVSSEPSLAKAKTIRLSIDSTKLIEFVPTLATKGEGVETVGFGSNNALEISTFENALGTSGQFLRVTTPDFSDQVPTTGLTDALKDFRNCRESAWQEKT